MVVLTHKLGEYACSHKNTANLQGWSRPPCAVVCAADCRVLCVRSWLPCAVCAQL